MKSVQQFELLLEWTLNPIITSPYYYVTVTLLQVVGEYAYVSEEVETEEILERVTSLLNRKFEDPDTHGWVVAMVTKLVSQLGYMPDEVQSQVAVYLTSTSTDTQQVTNDY